MGANSDRAKVATSSIVRLISVPSPKGRDSSAPPCYITSTSMRGYKAWRNFRESPKGEVRRIYLPRRWVKKGPVGREDGISVPDRVMASIVHGRGPLVL
jgi:hypothetical protein